MNNKSLTGKVAIVTGGSRGIGASIAARLSRDGAIVIATYRENGVAAGRVIAEIEANLGEAEAVQADVSKLEDVQRLFNGTIENYGRIDILVNNAGVAALRPLEQADDEHYNYIFDVNVRGALFAMREAARCMGSDGGRIINISSGAAQSTPPAFSVYSASKAALEALTKSIAGELGSRKITVNVVAPGLTTTDMMNDNIPVAAQNAMIERTALGRLGTPEDIADVVAYLASDDARWITGQIIGASGGLR